MTIIVLICKHLKPVCKVGGGLVFFNAAIWWSKCKSHEGFFLPVTLLLCVAKKNKRAQQTLSQSDKHVALIKASHLYISADVVDPESGGKEISLTLELN